MPKRVSEALPIQVYLKSDEQRRLERLAEQIGSSKSEALRRGMLALERELIDPAAHPALRLIGLVAAESETASAIDAAREHDRELADAEEASWRTSPTSTSRKKRPTKRRAR